MADSSSRKDTTMRRKDFKGAQEWTKADCSISDRTVWRLSGRKISGSWRFVNRRVFDGGVGWVSGGIVLRSRDILEGTEPDEVEDLLERSVGDELDVIFFYVVSMASTLRVVSGRLYRCPSAVEIVSRVFECGNGAPIYRS